MRLIVALFKIATTYLAFGVLFAVLGFCYCTYRASAGNPSDLPCVSWLWTPMDVLFWLPYALSLAWNGRAALMPDAVVRAVGIVFLGGFLGALAWWIRRPGSTRPAPR